ncbi:MAG: Rho GTPase [Trizodia sp. TS-e1964]|nr:MAG: Rho GTPase [Trizodia sp. TS-e1964]
MSYQSYDQRPAHSRQTSYMEERQTAAYESPRRKAVQNSARTSSGTVSTSFSGSSGHESAATNITQPPSFSKKIVVVGDGGSGDSQVILRGKASVTDASQKYVPTVFENYITHTTHSPTGKTVELALWDTAGQEEYDRLRPLSYPETDLIFVCFAIDCPNSLENVMDKWYPEVTHFCPDIPVILVGLKSDLRTKRTCIEMLKTQGLTPVTPEQGRGVAKEMKAMYMECSSKDSRGVDEIFDAAVTMAVGNAKERVQGVSSAQSSRASVKKRRTCKIL